MQTDSNLRGFEAGTEVYERNHPAGGDASSIHDHLGPSRGGGHVTSDRKASSPIRNVSRIPIRRKLHIPWSDADVDLLSQRAAGQIHHGQAVGNREAHISLRAIA